MRKDPVLDDSPRPLIERVMISVTSVACFRQYYFQKNGLVVVNVCATDRSLNCKCHSLKEETLKTYFCNITFGIGICRHRSSGCVGNRSG